MGTRHEWDPGMISIKELQQGGTRQGRKVPHINCGTRIFSKDTRMFQRNTVQHSGRLTGGVHSEIDDCDWFIGCGRRCLGNLHHRSVTPPAPLRQQLEPPGVMTASFDVEIVC